MHRQSPLLSIVEPVDPPLSEWAAEAEVMRDVGVEIRRRALMLPSASAVRADLLESASEWLGCARMRGAQAPALTAAGQLQTG